MGLVCLWVRFKDMQAIYRNLSLEKKVLKVYFQFQANFSSATVHVCFIGKLCMEMLLITSRFLKTNPVASLQVYNDKLCRKCI